MRVDDFNFELPPERIALRPVEPRDAARLLAVHPGAVPERTDSRIADLPALLRPGDVLVVNDTSVIPARLQGHRQRGGAGGPAVSVTLHRRLGGGRWHAFAKPGRRLTAGDRIAFGGPSGPALSALVETKGEGGEIILAFDRCGADFDALLAALGRMPLPPYIAARRPADDRDAADYQTIFAARAGAVAAPTAGLHFTEDLLARLAAAGIGCEALTLHVGAGTFLPVKVADTDDHRMHAEWGALSAATAARLNAARRVGGRIVAAGTTVLRLLESAAGADGTIRPFSGETAIFITPGHRFRAVDVLLTNFHLPRSTLFMLVSAFSGLPVMKRAYAHAVAAGYRFYSYGDACLLWPGADDNGKAPGS